MTEPPVLTRVHGGVAYVLLNRPEVRNAVTVGLARALHEALSDAAVYSDVIVVRGAGGNFCAGGDLDEVARLRQHGAGAEALRPLFETFIAVCELIAELPIPVVAAVEGVAMAGGFELVRSVDIAIVRDDAVLSDNHANIGMIPGGGGSQRLPRIIGMPRALGVSLTGESMTGRQAADWGLVYRSVPPMDFENAVAGLAANLEAKDRAALTRIKHGLRTETEATPAHMAGPQAGTGIGRFASRGRRAVDGR